MMTSNVSFKRVAKQQKTTDDPGSGPSSCLPGFLALALQRWVPCVCTEAGTKWEVLKEQVEAGLGGDLDQAVCACV